MISNKLIGGAKELYATACRKVAVAKIAPSTRQAQTILFAAGVTLLALGLSHDVLAASQGGVAEYNDTRITNALNMVLTYLEGSFGALVMAAAGIGAILSAAFGQYRAALSLMVVAIGAFILRSLMSTFFNDTNVQE